MPTIIQREAANVLDINAELITNSQIAKIDFGLTPAPTDIVFFSLDSISSGPVNRISSGYP